MELTNRKSKEFSYKCQRANTRTPYKEMQIRSKLKFGLNYNRCVEMTIKKSLRLKLYFMDVGSNSGN